MKRLLLASSIIAASTGFAAAEIAVSGTARMGIIDNFGDDNLGFTSRIRVNFDMSGETDGGLAFGASVRADNSDEANDSGSAGSVFISGAFGKLSMGDVDGAANAAVGQVSGVGLTGLDDRNEIRYLANGGGNFGGGDVSVDPSALYEYSAGAFTGYFSATNPSGTMDALALGAKYAFGNFTVAGAIEQASFDGFTWNHYVIGATATFGAVTAKAIYGHTTEDAPIEYDQYAVSVDYATGALTLTAFASNTEDFAATIHPDSAKSGQHYGLGASYDLGGGAKFVGGYVKDQTDDESAFDLGVSFSF